jgi:glycosyltransferase involved in cell wall biosynthesis
MLALMREAQVILAPSLVDGIPNTLYEAMAAGAVPIVSPLPTLTPHFRDGEHVFYARNLYPKEIASAIVRAFTSPDLDNIVKKNRVIVLSMANRNTIEEKTVELYNGLVNL